MLLLWKLRAMIYDIKDFFVLTVGSFLGNVIDLARRILYAILSICYRIGVVAFLVSFYFIYECIVEYQQGIEIENMQNIKPALILFIAPILVSILKELVRPKY